MNYPKVTIITPTTSDRKEFNANLARMVSTQDYTGEIEHLWDYSDEAVGTKRNNLCAQATGSIIIHCDSDDYYSPQWISKSVEALIDLNVGMTGLTQAYFFDIDKKNLTKYIYATDQTFILGATMCYYKSIWEFTPFMDKNEGEDKYFQSSVNRLPHTHINDFCASIHDANTCKRHTFMTNCYEPVDINIKKILPLP